MKIPLGREAMLPPPGSADAGEEEEGCGRGG